MTWLAWRTQRALVVLLAAAVAGFAVWLLTVGFHEQGRWLFFTGHGCPSTSGHGAVCEGFDPYNFTHWNPYFNGLLDAFPGVVGLVLGAPLVASEIEHRTNRLSWTQSLTRTRWLLTKGLVGGLACALIALGLIALGRWWTSAVRAGTDIVPGNFDLTGIVVVGYTIFAFGLGAALGALLRRTGWAVAFSSPRPASSSATTSVPGWTRARWRRQPPTFRSPGHGPSTPATSLSATRARPWAGRGVPGPTSSRPAWTVPTSDCPVVAACWPIPSGPRSVAR
jgi:hypothetical protein